MRKSAIICILLCLVLLTQFFVLPVSAADMSVSSGSHSVNAAIPLSESKKLLKTSKAVILYELNSDTMVYAWKPDEQIYPASMVKLMTAIVALERGNLSDTVLVTKSALNVIAGKGSVVVDLVAGEELTLEALLYCLMVPSANDAAVVIAEHIAGSQEAFVQMMNEKAQQLGCTGTNYTNVHGLHDKDMYTTARDICRILEYGLEDERFEAMFTAKTYTVPATDISDERVVQTSNYMMSTDYISKFYDERVTGGKTGSTDKAGRCLAVTAEANGMKLIGLVMGAKPTYAEEGIVLQTHGNFEEMKVLLDFASSGFEYRQIFYTNQALKQYPVSGGANDIVTQPTAELSTVLPIGVDETKLNWIYGDAVAGLKAPVEKGQVVSDVQVWYENICLAQTDLVAANRVDAYQQPISSDLIDDTNVDVSAVWIVVGIIVGVAVLFVAVLLILRAVSAARMRQRQRRRRRNRRRDL